MSPPLWSFTNTRLSMIIIANYGSIIMVIPVGPNVCPLSVICIVLSAGPFITYFMDICTQIQNLYFLHVLLKTPPAKCWYLGVLMTFLFPYHWHLTENENVALFRTFTIWKCVTVWIQWIILQIRGVGIGWIDIGLNLWYDWSRKISYSYFITWAKGRF